ncbi:penicillin-binding protein [Candidatus Gottesmanbacteria bacterium]|nr:penicillin-binding protein [Candidatus Gottesmanbacteria bacterium]
MANMMYTRRLLKRFFGLSRYFGTGVGSKILFLGVVGLVGAFLVTLVLFFIYSRDLPEPDQVRRVDNLSTIIYDRDGKVLYDIYEDQNRIPVPLSEMPGYLKEATIAIEDKDFYKHSGVDIRGMLRAVFNILTFQGLQGGSTLSQQLVKNVLLTSERNIPRKIKEFILTVNVERRYSKDEILQMYLNEAPYGGTSWGVESAAQTYFGKSAADLNLVESAILAGLPQRPSIYSPFGSEPTAYIKRTEDVLRRMREDGYITRQQEEDAKKKLPNIEFSDDRARFKAPHFVTYVRQQLVSQFSEEMVENGGLRVTTTIDGELQEQVEEIVSEEIDKLKNLDVSNGAAVVLDPKTGEILSMVGSKDYFSEDPNFQGKFNVAVQGLRQPGSALKPITYATAFSEGYTPSSVVMDVETHFPGGTADQKDYEPKNYDGKFRGPIQIRYALGNSVNIPAVKTTAWVGVKDILQTSYNLGLSTLEPTQENLNRVGLSITLGGGEVSLLELTSAYGVFANKGVYQPVVSILKVTDANKQTIYEYKPSKGRNVLDEGIAFLISHILQDNDSRRDVFGPNSYLKIAGRTVSVKTGTTDENKDNWAIGYTGDAVVGVWVGNNDNSSMNSRLVSGVTGAAPIWRRVMGEALKDKPNWELSVPGNVTQVEIDAFAGGLPRDGMPKRMEYFIKGTEPTSVSPVYKKLKLAKGDNKKLASVVDVATGNYDEKEFYVFEEKDPVSTDGKNRFWEGIMAWANGQSDERYKIPGETVQADENTVVISIKKPGNEEKLDNNDVEVRAEASAVKPIKKMEIFIDGALKKSQENTNSLNETFTLEVGVHTIKVRAEAENGKSGESEIRIGVKTDPKSVTPTVSPSPTPTP